MATTISASVANFSSVLLQYPLLLRGEVYSLIALIWACFLTCY